MCDESHHLTLFIAAEGFEETRVEFDLIPLGVIPHNEPSEPVEPTPEPPMEGM